MKSQVSKLIPKGKGYNIAEFYKNGKSSEGIFTKYAQEGGHKHTMMQCNCCTQMVPAVIVETGGVKDIIPLHMPCRVCDKWTSHLELENHQVLDGMCLECFTEEIEQ
jgi:hypothetical protein